MGWTHISENMLGWDTKKLSIHVNTNNCLIEDVDLFAVVDAAIKTWNSIPTSGLVIERDAAESIVTVVDFLAGSATEVPLILCDPNFGTDNGVDSNLIPAATRMAKDSTSHLAYGGILLNAQVNAAAEVSKLSSSELAITLTHELGHILGLGHSSSKEALMYYSIADKPGAFLTQDDMDGISYLYPRNEFQGNPFGCGAIHDHGAKQPFFLSCLMIFVMLGIARFGRLRGSQG